MQAEKAKRLGLVHDLIEPLGPGLGTPDEMTLALLEKVAVDCAKYAYVYVLRSHVLFALTYEYVTCEPPALHHTRC